MIRLHVWTIVLDLCISAEADRPAPAVVRRLRTLDQGTAMLIPSLAHIGCSISATARLLDRSKPISVHVFDRHELGERTCGYGKPGLARNGDLVGRGAHASDPKWCRYVRFAPIATE